MEKDKTIEILKALASEADSRSESARLKEIIEDVESALKAGVKRQIVLNALHEHYGFKMSMSGFEKALRKLRKNNTPITIANRNSELVRYSNNENKVTGLIASDNCIENTSFISEQAYLIDKKNTDDKESGSKKHMTPKELRKIRENALKKLDDDLNGNYD